MTINEVQTASQKEFYGELLQRLKQRINGVRQHIVLSANQQQILLYYEIGREIIEQQEQQGWGAKVIDRLSTDLRTAFPDMRGLSNSNLKYMKMFAQAYPFLQISQQSADQIEYALSGIEKPMGIAEYQLVKALPEPLDICLPTIDEIESSLNSLRETLKNTEQKQ
ncbi:hypothetical protein FACS1894170_00390 [Planctomycetales bacterium]|nr:hypothetical protein FACS1894170_00390 [Planctomycetales bacterium]